MKKVLLLLLIFVSFSALKAQNVQLHYDMGKGRSYVTSTVEMFKADKYGSNFFFIDMDYNARGVQGVSLAYMEIARGIKFWDSPFEIQIEHDGGFGRNKDNSSFRINDAWLFGGNYHWNTADYSKVFTLELLYKTIRGKNKQSFQVTGVWDLRFFKNKVTLSGFADFWREDNNYFVNALLGTTSDFVFLSEPQFWYNVDKHLSLGGEVEVASNFSLHKGFKACPTVAVKWNF